MLFIVLVGRFVVPNLYVLGVLSQPRSVICNSGFAPSELHRDAETAIVITCFAALYNLSLFVRAFCGK